MGMTSRVAMVTGAAQGIGAAVARALAGGGVSVAAVDTQEDGVAALAAEVRASGGQAAAFRADVSDSAAVERVCRAD